MRVVPGKVYADRLWMMMTSCGSRRLIKWYRGRTIQSDGGGSGAGQKWENGWLFLILLPVVLSIFDARGRRVRELVRQQQSPGLHRAMWDGRNEQGAMVPSGVYLYQLRSHETTVTDRMLMSK
jgi:hypothetical protein